MTQLTIDQAELILAGALRKGRELALSPLTIAVVDEGGNLKLLKREDGPGGAIRPQIAIGKAFGAVGMGRSSRALEEMALQRPHFGAALIGLTGGRFVPVAGGLPIVDGDGRLIGAVGVTGDTSDNDEAAAIAGIEAAGLRYDS